MPTAYMDHADATFVKGAVIEAMAPYFDQRFGNPSAVYDLGIRCKQVLEAQRAKVAGLIGARPDEIIFTSSGAEANNLAIKGVALARPKKGRHIIVSAIEHHSVLNSVRYTEKAMDHFTHPRNAGTIDDADGIGEVGNPVCGDMMTFYIKVKDDKLVDVKFQTFGCVAAIAVTSMVSEMAIGKGINEAKAISKKAVAESLVDFPGKKCTVRTLAPRRLPWPSPITKKISAVWKKPTHK